MAAGFQFMPRCWRTALWRALDICDFAVPRQRLGTVYIDLYFMHWWDFTTPVEEVQRALTDADLAPPTGDIVKNLWGGLIAALSFRLGTS